MAPVIAFLKRFAGRSTDHGDTGTNDA
jgi:hypothetical protein